MFMGPLDVIKPWADNGVKGVSGFLGRVFKFFAHKENITGGEEDPEILKELHYTIKKVARDIEDLKFNTAISQMMIFTNACIKKGKVTHDTASRFIKVLSPFAPHIAEEIWEIYGNKGSIATEEYPAYDEKYLASDTFEYPVSFNGKLRFKIELPVDMAIPEIEKNVLAHPNARKWVEGKQLKKIIVVPNKIINVVVV